MAVRKRAVASASKSDAAIGGDSPSAAPDASEPHPSVTNAIKGNTSSPTPAMSAEPEKDQLSLMDMVPAIAVTALVSVGSYYSCASVELAEDVVVATVRTFLQLSLLAAMLSPLFKFVDEQHRNGRGYSAPFLVLAYVFCFMLPIAAYEASSRSKLTLRPPDSPYNNVTFMIVMVSLLIAVSTMGSVAIFAIVRPVPRHSPRHVVPLCGMLFNNALSAISIALDVLFTELHSKQRETIELMISFGADSWTATRPSFRRVLASSLKPQINSMSVIGLVAIPGMMTGQVLGGASPTRAARYQIMIMCLILGANFISLCIASELLIWNAFDGRGALKDDWITENDSLRVSQLVSSFAAPWKATGQGDFVEGGSSPQPPEETIDVELLVQSGAVPRQPSGTSTSLTVSLDGSFAKGTRSMTANFAVSNGIVALKGPSGGGKSTLLKSIAELNSGLVTRFDSISLSGRDRSLFLPSEWRRDVLYLPQTGASALQGTPDSFLRFIAASARRKHSRQGMLSLETLTSQTALYLDAWGIESPSGKLSQPWSKLSGGEGQRVLLAIAISVKPAALLLDEATSALDTASKLAVERTMKKIAENSCIIMVTHDEDQIERLATTVMSLDVLTE